MKQQPVRRLRQEMMNSFTINMTRLKKSIQILLLLLLMAWSAQACLPGKRLARHAVGPADTISVCLIDPVFLYMQNMKTWEIEGYDSIPENQRDSVAFYNSLFLKKVDDSTFVNRYTQTIRKSLQALHVRLYTADSMDAFLASGGQLYLFNIAQMSLEEYVEPVKKTWALDTSLYWEIWCNAVGFNVWYEASVLNDTSRKMEVLFGNMYVRDNVKGRFFGDFAAGDISYYYNLDSISLQSVYNLAERAGQTHSEYIYDYILNDQMKRKAKSGSPPAEYMHYDPIKKTYRKAGTHRFMVVK